MPSLYPGDPAPWFTAPTRSNPNFVFSSVGGRYVVLMFLPSIGGEPALAQVQANRALFDDDRIAFFGVSADPADQVDARIQDQVPGVRWFFDPNGEVAELYGARTPDSASAPAWFLIDPSLRIIAAGLNAQVDRLIAICKSLPPPELHAGPPVWAPVLLVPRIFEPELCRALIEVYDKEGGTPSGFMREINGVTVGVSDENHKRRSDVMIEDEALKTQLRLRILRRLVPEVKKAFQFETTRMERYLVACYEGQKKGMFRAHRDNTTKGTAHRKFAVSINLNTEEYEGGDLRFPEFGPRLYRPPTGGAVVFSCSLLHEATPVTSGRRFVFVPFLYDEAGAKIREENMKHVDPSIQGYRAGAARPGLDQEEVDAAPQAASA